MLVQLDGFVDAGAAGRLATEHLLATLDHRVVARFDVDGLLDYRSRRPMMIFDEDHWSEYSAPELVVRLAHDSAGTPFLMLTGPEPDRAWERFAAAVQDVVERLGVGLVVTFHGIPMAVPHTRPLGVTAHGTRKDLVSEYRPWGGKVQVPGSAPALLEFRLAEAGHDAIGFAVHVPHYLAQAEYPQSSLTALESISLATGLVLPTDALRQAAERTQSEIEQQIAASPEIASAVEGLEQQYDAYNRADVRGSLLADEATPVPTADELAAQFERFLAEQDERDPEA
ncbi:PAC2 family protein [Bailinhaonella thermotolerans]|uniref:PAC2 family protein n=2 Tax=Bailinhaonella thermotolerans TaxID=1070861 RepID=A0A3A4BA94_9ACTN|nr:PAC2 family protein [Bailinhaonella thermotolerans]